MDDSVLLRVTLSIRKISPETKTTESVIVHAPEETSNAMSMSMEVNVLKRKIKNLVRERTLGDH